MFSDNSGEMYIKWNKNEIFKLEDYAESRRDHKYRVCKQTKNESVPSDPFRRCFNLRKYDKFICESQVSNFVRQAAGEREQR